jgi:microcystin-dependent protein
MIMGSDPQLPMTGGSEYITEAQLPAHSHPYYGPYFAQTNRLTGGPTFMTYMGRQLNSSDAITNGVPDQATEVVGSGQAYYPRYIQTYMWTKILTSTTIIYSAAGDAMGTVADLLDVSYPIGSVVARSSQVTTSYLFSEAQSQTWVQFAQGRTLVGQDSSDTAFDGVTPTAYIGEKEHTLTISEIPSHTHTYVDRYRNTSGGAGQVFNLSSGSQVALSSPTVNTGSTGGGQAHNNVQPYEVVYYYKRTA